MFKPVIFAVVAVVVLAIDHQLQKHGGHGMPRWLMVTILVPLGLWLRIDFGDNDYEPTGRNIRKVLLPIAAGFCLYLSIVGWTMRDTFVLAPVTWMLAPVGLLILLWWIVELVRGSSD